MLCSNSANSNNNNLINLIIKIKSEVNEILLQSLQTTLYPNKLQNIII